MESKTKPLGYAIGTGTHRDLVDPWATMSERSCKKEVSKSRTLRDRPKEIDKRCKRY